MQNQQGAIAKGTRGLIDGPGASLLDEEVSLPAAVIYESRLQHNLHWMRKFADRYGAALAPHGKTTMAPALFRRQLDAGAWGITLATAVQVLEASRHGVGRILMANQLVGKQNMALVAEAMLTHGLSFYCLLDSAENLQQLDDFFSAAGLKLPVLIEMGVPGGRCGLRSPAAVLSLAEQVQQSRSVLLAGIETYEGVIHDEQPDKAIVRHLREVRHCCEQLLERQLFATPEVLLSGAGSAWFDLVCEVFCEDLPEAIVPLIRPGCYLIHDHGLCDCNQQKLLARSSVARELGDSLQSAMEIWAYVQSVPEPGLAIVAMGKRDLAFDAGLPVPLWHFRPATNGRRDALAGWQVKAMMDQHAMLHFPASETLLPGDIIAFGMSHPCLTFDKWRKVNLVNDQAVVVEELDIFF